MASSPPAVCSPAHTNISPRNKPTCCPGENRLRLQSPRTTSQNAWRPCPADLAPGCISGRSLIISWTKRDEQTFHRFMRLWTILSAQDTTKTGRDRASRRDGYQAQPLPQRKSRTQVEIDGVMTGVSCRVFAKRWSLKEHLKTKDVKPSGAVPPESGWTV